MARPPDTDDNDFRPTLNRRSEADDAAAARAPRAARSHGLRGLLGRDRLVSAARTLAWLVPLTLLIWVYAEQQQEYRGTVSGIPVYLQSAVPNRFIQFADAPQQQQAVNLTLSGPRDAVDRVSKQLLVPPGLPLEVGSRGAGAGQVVNVMAAVQNLPLFRSAGVTVVDSQPPDVRVDVDNIVERDDATVVLGAHATQFSGTVTFDPPRVKLRGPKSQMDALAAGGAPVVYADLSKVDLRQPGDHTEAVPVALPAGSTAEQQVRVLPAQVQAKVQVTTAYVTGVIESVPILVTAPPAVWHDYDVKVGDNDVSIPYVHVTGPADKVALVTKQNGQPPRVQATAELSVQLDDVNQDRQGTLAITNLPDGVRPTPEDAARKIAFKLIPRTPIGG